MVVSLTVPDKFSNPEYADMIFFVYWLCIRNAPVAQQQYHQRFPNRRFSGCRIFSPIFHFSRKTRLFPSNPATAQRQEQLRINHEGNLIQLIESSSRRLSYHASLSLAKRNLVMKNISKRYALFFSTTKNTSPLLRFMFKFLLLNS